MHIGKTYCWSSTKNIYHRVWYIMMFVVSWAGSMVKLTNWLFTKVLAVFRKSKKMVLEPSFACSCNYWWCKRIWLDIRAKVNSYITVVSLAFLSVLHYNINLMAELEIYPEKPEEGDTVIKQKPQKRKYKKDKPLDVKTIYVVKGDIFLDFQWATCESLRQMHRYESPRWIIKGFS